MTDTKQRIRAVFLAALMVLSVFGGTVAFAGTAVAGGTIGADFDGASTFVAQGGDTVTVNGDIVDEGEEAIIYVDKNDNGEYDDGNGESVATGANVDGSFEATFSAPGETNLESPGATNVYVVSSAYAGAPLAPGDSFADHTQKVGTLVVDDTVVSFNANSPTDGDIINTATPTIRQNITDGISGVDEGSVQVTITKGSTVFYTYNIDSSASDDGVDFSNNNITVQPGDGNVPALEDGSYTVDISTSDEAGNSDSTTFGFEVDTEAISFDLTSPTDGATVGDVTQPISVELNSQSDIDSANFTVYNESGEYSKTLTDADLSSGVFNYVPGTDGAELPNGTIYVDVNATDTAGNYNEASYSFEVDNIKPNVESVELSSDSINTENDEGSETLTVTFDEEVDASSVEALVSDGDSNTVTLSSSSSGGKVVSFDFDLSGLSATTNESALVEVTAAQDLVSNELNQTKNTTFSIDTEEPTVTFNEIGQGGAISGYANFTGDIEISGDDVASVEHYILIDDSSYDEKEDKADLKSINDIEHVDTRDYKEGAHTLIVYVTDESGNEVYNTADLYVDNKDATISFVGDMVVTGEVDISSLFSVENTGAEEVTYFYAKDGGAFVKADSFNVNELGEGTYTVKAEVVDPGYSGPTHTVSVSKDITGEKLTASDLEITAVQNESDSGLIDVTISTTNGLRLDSVNTSITATDGHVDEFNGVYEFPMTVEKATAGGYAYSATFYAPRDGTFQFAIDEATSGGQHYDASTDDAVTPASADADGSDADITNAHVVDGGSNSLDIHVTFDEPVTALDVNNFEFAGDADVVNVIDNGDGTAVVTLNAEAQTANAPDLTAVGVVESTGAGDANTSAVGVETIELELEQGVNVVSIPAETGSVNVEDVFAHAAIESVYAYEGDGEWSSYVPGASENSLSTLEGGEGYIVKATDDVTLSVNAENVPAEGKQAIQQQSLNAGWNLIGHYQEGSQSVGQALAPLGDRTFSVQQGYTGMQVDQLDAGEGYWLFVDESGYHVPIDYEGMNSEQPTVANVQVADDNGGELEQGDIVTITADVADENIVDSVHASSSELGISADLTDDNDDGTYEGTATVDFGDVTPGATYGVFVTATDIDGNMGYTFGDAPAVETTAPTASSNSLAETTNGDGTVMNGDSVTVSVSSETGLTVEADASAFGAGQAVSLTETDGTYTGTFTVDQASATEGDQNVSITMTDAAGNSNTVTTDSLTVDTTAPTSTVSASFDDSTDSYTVTITGDEALDASSISVDVADSNDAVQKTLTGFSAVDGQTNTYSASYTVGSGVDDTYTATLTAATDLAGNSDTNAGTATSAGIAVDTTAPTATSLTGATTNTLTLTFSEGVSLNADGSGPLTTSQLSFTDSDSGGVTITDVTHNAGDSTATITLSSADSTTSDSVTITSAYYDEAGNEANTGGGETVTASA